MLRKRRHRRTWATRCGQSPPVCRERSSCGEQQSEVKNPQSAENAVAAESSKARWARPFHTARKPASTCLPSASCRLRTRSPCSHQGPVVSLGPQTSGPMSTASTSAFRGLAEPVWARFHTAPPAPEPTPQLWGLWVQCPNQGASLCQLG